MSGTVKPVARRLGIFTPDEAAEELRVSPRQVREWCQDYRDTRGQAGLRHARLGPRLIRIRSEDIALFFGQRST